MRERFKLDFKAINSLEIAFYTKNISLEFIRSVMGDNPFTINSFVSEQNTGTAKVFCEMLDLKGRPLSRCEMSLVCIDKASGRPCSWPDGFMEQFYE